MAKSYLRGLFGLQTSWLGMVFAKYIYIVILSVFVFSQNANSQIYVNQQTKAVFPDGKSWETAFANLHDAFNVALQNDEIWISKGNYFPSETNDREAYFTVPNHVKIYGGFLGNETSLLQRDFVNHETIINGDIGLFGDTTDNSFTLFYMEDVNDQTVIDGLIFINANASESNSLFSIKPPACGGAMYIYSKNKECRPTISNCKFIDNHAQFRGGAVFIHGDQFSAVPKFEKCMFKSNVANFGGGINYYNLDQSDSVKILSYCSFIENDARFQGGGAHIAQLDSYVILENTFFEGNSAVVSGGGLSLNGQGSSSVLISKGIFQNNFEKSVGGSIYCLGSFTKPYHITIAESIFRNDGSGPNLEQYGNIAAVASPIVLSIEGSEFINCQVFGYNLSRIEIDRSSFSKFTFTPFLCIECDTVDITNSIFSKNHVDISIQEKLILVDHSIGDYFNFQNNTIVENTLGSGSILSVFSKKSFLRNSVFYDCQNLLIASEKLFYFSDSVVFQNCAIDLESFEDHISSFDFAEPYVGNFLNNIVDIEEPFISLPQSIYELKSCSELVNSGVMTYDNLEQIDFNGKERIIEDTVDIGANECKYPFVFKVQEKSDVRCYGGDTGKVLLLANGYEPSELVVNNDPFDVQELNNSDLAAGEYYLTFKDNVGCSDSLEFSIQQPDSIRVVANKFSENICKNAGNGEIQLKVNGGVGPYELMWSTGENGLELNNLSAGNYVVTIIDANQCSQSQGYQINEHPEIQIDYTAEEPTFGGQQMNGKINIESVSGGLPPYLLFFNEELSNLSSFSFLPPGSYVIKIVDSLNCSQELIINLKNAKEPDQIKVFPNPYTIGETLNIEIFFNREALFILEIYDENKRLISEHEFKVEMGLNHFNISPSLTAGHYILYFREFFTLIKGVILEVY